jgi:hypothetical protein
MSSAQCVKNAIHSKDRRQHCEEPQHLGAAPCVGRPPDPRQPRRWVGGAQYRYLASVQSGTDDGQRASRAPPDERHYVMMAQFGELPPVVGLYSAAVLLATRGSETTGRNVRSRNYDLSGHISIDG